MDASLDRVRFFVAACSLTRKDSIMNQRSATGVDPLVASGHLPMEWELIRVLFTVPSLIVKGLDLD